MCLKPDKSPGLDGLTANFYSHFWEQLREFFLQVFNAAKSSLSLPPSMKQGIITLIPKPEKGHWMLEKLPAQFTFKQ